MVDAMKRLRIFVIIVGIAVFGADALLVFLKGDNIHHAYLRWKVRTAAGENRLRAVRALSDDLRIGMSKSEVRAIIGCVDNPEKDDVWMWGCSKSRVPRSGERWWYDDFFDNAALFMVFRDGRLVTPLLKSTESDPWDALRSFTGSSEREADVALGSRPIFSKANETGIGK
jgi:hypothetical protein